MPQAHLTDDQFTTVDENTPSTSTDTVTDTDPVEQDTKETESVDDEPVEPAYPAETTDPDTPLEEHSDVQDIDDLGDMALENPSDGWPDFPHPATITTYVAEDESAHQAVLPDEVHDGIDAITDKAADDEAFMRSFLVMKPNEVYEYLRSLQWKNDLHLETFERQQINIDYLSGGNGYSKGANLSHGDKKKIVRWEIARRMETRELDEWTEHKLTKENNGLPNADD